jgi:DNA (cytosine-5)-methyltransferase 1
LDLFCGGGGAAMGYARAGFEVVGVDINRQPNYPFHAIQGNAIAIMDRLVSGEPWFYRLADFDVIHASPPCQLYTRKASTWGRDRTHYLEHPDLIEPTRELLIATGLPYVLENVPGAPIDAQLELCGTHFGLRIIKHRLFEANWPLPMAPASCDHSDVYNPWAGADRSAAKLRAAMDIDWLPISGGASRKAGYTGDLFNAIPPAYTEWIGAQLMREVTAIPAPVETSNGHRARSEARPAGAETVAANSEMRPSGRVAGSV